MLHSQISILLVGGLVYPVFARSSQDNYILPVILVYPAVWTEKNTGATSN